MANPTVSRDAQLLDKQNALLAQSAMLRQRARQQTAMLLEPLAPWHDVMRWLHSGMPCKALWALGASSLLFGKTRPWGVQGLRLWRLWRSLSVWYKR